MEVQDLPSLNQAQRDRLAHIDLRMRFLGEVRRQDLVGRFGIQTAAATRDLALYKRLAPRNLAYDGKEKVYARGEWFRPLFAFSAERVLTWLAHGVADTEPIAIEAAIRCEDTLLPSRLDLEILSAITRGMHQERPVEIAYRALSSGLTNRVIAPFALSHGGERWHVRAFDRRSGEFRDFALGRVAEANLLAAPVTKQEAPSQDHQWNRITELELVPHPANVQHPDTIEAEYGMENGVCRVSVRAAMAGYLLRRWNVDCTNDHSLKGAQYHLWLRNRQALYGVSNLVLAPGYELGVNTGVDKHR